MRVAVAGGTGLVGRLVVDRLAAAGHEFTVLARANGVDLTTGRGLAEALPGVDTVIDVSNSAGTRKSASIGFFQAATNQLLRAETAAGIGHHLALSIVGIDLVPFGYYFGKRRQEALIAAGPVPWTIQRATQFHEFPAQLLDQFRGPLVPVPRMRTQPIAAAEVAERLVTLAEAGPAERVPDLAGPEVLDLPTMTRQLLARRGARRWAIPVRLPGDAGRGLRDGGLLPIGDGPRGAQTFQQWLLSVAT